MSFIVYDSGWKWQERVGMKVLALVLLLAPWGYGQKLASARAGMVYFAEGAITVNGKPLRAGSRDRRPQLNDGDIVASPRGHAEFLMGPDAMLWSGTGATLRFDDTSIESARVTLLSGAAIVELKRRLNQASIQVEYGGESVTLSREGVYRFNAQPAAIQSSGERTNDEFHYWAAYRSLILEAEAGSYRQWHHRGFEEREHSGFGVRFPIVAGAARVKSLAAGEAGIIYHMEGNALFGGTTRVGRNSTPLRLGRENFIRTNRGHAEVFLGVGIVARLAEQSQLRMVDTTAAHPSIAIDDGVALIEVSKSAENVKLRVRVDGSVTELLKPGLYRFDAQRGSLQVYGGQSASIVADAPVRAKDAQAVNLRTLEPVSGFQPDAADTLYKWSADRSYTLYATAAFMTGWEESLGRDRIHHKQYGARPYKFPRTRRPRAL